jgi:integrase
VKRMNENKMIPLAGEYAEQPFPSNVKPSRKKPRHERFGETIRYLTVEELQQFFDVIENYRHKLMMRMIYELGCRVGEFVRIQLKNLSFPRNTVCFPAENTKTGFRRVSHLPAGLVNELKGMLRAEGRMAKRTTHIKRPADYLYHPGSNTKQRYSENRIRQLFARYAHLAQLDHEYGRDRKGRILHALTVHSLRHSHIMHYVHAYRLPLDSSTSAPRNLFTISCV